MNIVFPHIESQFEFTAPEIRQLSPNNVQLATLLLFVPLIEHPLFELTIEDEPLRVPFRKKLRDQPVLLNQHHWIASKFEPEGQGIFLLSTVAMQDQVPQAIDRTKLVDVATSDPQHLINGSFFGSIKRFLEGLFKLSGGEEFNVHAMKATHVVPGSLIQVNCIAILILELDVSSLSLILFSPQLVNISLALRDLFFGRSAHLRRLPHQVFAGRQSVLLASQLLEDPLYVDLGDLEGPSLTICILNLYLLLAGQKLDPLK